VRIVFPARNPREHLTTVANIAEYLVGDLAAFVSGQHLLITEGAPARSLSASRKWSATEISRQNSRNFSLY
jgi:hypothetical protein